MTRWRSNGICFMADNTKIEWTDATYNPITGCSVVSPGCTNCYAMRLAGTRLQHHPTRAGLTVPSKAGPVWNGEVRFNESMLDQPLRWKRGRKIFVCAHGDLFHENVPDEWIDRVFGVMALAPQHIFQVLTKRPARMRQYLNARDGMGNADLCRAINKIPYGMGNRHGALSMPLPNVWLGVSVEDQKRADERIPDLLATPAARRFISAEPLLGPVDLTSIDVDRDRGWEDPLNALEIFTVEQARAEWGEDCVLTRDRPRIDWVIAGGESGPVSRPSHPDWFRSLRDQCAAAGVPFFFKQWGDWGIPTDRLGALDWLYHPDHDRTHWFDSRTCVRPYETGWEDKYKDGIGAFPPGFRVENTPEYLSQVAECPQFSCRAAMTCQGNQGRAAVTRVGKKAAGALLDGVLHRRMPA
jgi:protein gp37